MDSRCRKGGEEVSSTWQNDMLARKVADGTYVPRAYLAVGLGKKSRRQQSTRTMERAGREGSMEWFGGWAVEECKWQWGGAAYRA